MVTDEQITQYCTFKENEKALNKDIKKLNETIKQAMIDANEKEVHTDTYIIELEIRKKEDIDPTLLLMVLKKYWDKEHSGEPCPFIRTVEVIDEDALEKFMYSNKLPEDTMKDLDKYRTRTVTKALTYKKVKGK